MTKHFYDVHLRHHVILRHVMVRHIIVLLCHVGDIYVFVSSCKCYSRLVNVCHGFVPSCFCYFCHSNVLHAHACHAIVCHAIVTSCKCLSCNRGHVNERPTSASSCVPRWLHSGYGQPGKQKQEGADRGNLRRARSGRKMGRPACKFFTRGNCRVDNCRFEHVRYRQDNYLEQKEKILRQSLKKKKEDLEKLKGGTETDQSQGSSGSKRSSGGEPNPKRHRKSSSPPRRRNDARRK